MKFSQVVQNGFFEVMWNVDFLYRFNKSLLRLNEYALLGDNAIARIPGLPGPFVLVI